MINKFLLVIQLSFFTIPLQISTAIRTSQIMTPILLLIKPFKQIFSHNPMSWHSFYKSECSFNKWSNSWTRAFFF